MKACRPRFSAVGQPVLIGASMGTGSQILAGAATAEQRAFPSACHSAGAQCRAMRRSSNGAGARFRTIWRRRAFWFAARQLAAQPGGARSLQGCGRCRSGGRASRVSRRVPRLRPVICIKSRDPASPSRSAHLALDIELALRFGTEPGAESRGGAACSVHGCCFLTFGVLTWINAAARLPMHDIPCVAPIGFLFRTFLPAGLESPAR